MREIRTIGQLLAALPHGVRLRSGPLERSGTVASTVCADSRHAVPDCLFVCIVGAQSDGHRYVNDAYLAGCRAFVVQAGCTYEALPDDAAVFEADDTREALAHLACEFYGHPARSMRVVGITGTKGKTTVAMMCHHITTALGLPSGYIGTCGVRYGNVRNATSNTTPDPLTLQRYLYEMKEAGIRAVFLEASSQALWQRRVDGIPFAVCALTNLYTDHVGTNEHPSMEHYAACKRRLLTDLGAPTLIGNADDAAALSLFSDITGNVILCGQAVGAHLRAEQIRTEQQGVLPFTVFTCQDECGASFDVRLPMPGEHNVQNALFTLAILRALGLSIVQTAPHLPSVRIEGRFEMLEVKGALVVIDYAHNGASLRAALSTLRSLRPARLLCLFGSVGGRTQCRRAELGRAADELADFTYLTADDPHLEPIEDICRDIAAAFAPSFLPRYTVIPDRAAAIRQALDELKAGDILLIAGKGDESVQHIGGKRLAHSDRAVVEQYAEQLVLTV